MVSISDWSDGGLAPVKGTSQHYGGDYNLDVDNSTHSFFFFF